MVERRLWAWTVVALAAAAAAGHEAYAGNFTCAPAYVPSIVYFSFQLDPGQQIRYVGPEGDGDLEYLIDDLTYTCDAQPDVLNVNARQPLWNPVTEVTSYLENFPINPPPAFSFTVNNALAPPTPIHYTINGPSAAPFGGTGLPVVMYLVDRWSQGVGVLYETEMQEVDASGNIISRFDAKSHDFHANHFGYQQIIDDNQPGKTGAGGLDISESFVHGSESHHFQTPHIVDSQNRVQISSPTPPQSVIPYMYYRVYVKGRAIMGTGFPLWHNRHMVVQ